MAPLRHLAQLQMRIPLVANKQRMMVVNDKQTSKRNILIHYSQFEPIRYLLKLEDFRHIYIVVTFTAGCKSLE
jgi:hypothetical protein